MDDHVAVPPVAAKDGAIAAWVLGALLVIIGLALVRKGQWQAPVACTVIGTVCIIIGLGLWFGIYLKAVTGSISPSPSTAPAASSLGPSPSLGPGLGPSPGSLSPSSAEPQPPQPQPQPQLQPQPGPPALSSAPIWSTPYLRGIQQNMQNTQSTQPPLSPPLTQPHHHPQPQVTTPAKPILRGVNSDSGSSASAQTPRRETPKRVNWADDRAVGQGLGGQGGLAAQAPLEFVKTFDDKEAPAQVRAQYVQVASPHQPKPVPAAPRGQPHAPRKRPRPVQVAGAFDPQPTFPPENFGYETPYAHAAPLGMDSIQGGGIEGPTTGPGPVYYTPPSKYKTPDDIAKEREVLWNTPETPETTRRRRQGQLREAALSLKPDPMSVPIGIMVS